jgi:hypothetical protein
MPAPPHRPSGAPATPPASSSTPTTPPRASCWPPRSYDGDEPVNIGAGFEILIKRPRAPHRPPDRLHRPIVWDATKPDGQPRRMLDTSRAEKSFGFKAKVGFEEGLRETIAWYEQNREQDFTDSIHSPAVRLPLSAFQRKQWSTGMMECWNGFPPLKIEYSLLNTCPP